MSFSIKRRPVRQLSVDVARKIAAGEVIDRPSAIVRELLDNAVDSGADSITMEIFGGGIEKIRICDNGSGMTPEDLKNCARPHATSKIVDSEDLMNLTTLGFRGEALASIAAVAKLSISSGTCRMTASANDADHLIETISPVQNGIGTVVQSENLFEDFPARRLFLKRPATETMSCREIFMEKALPRPDIAFRLMVDGALRYDLPANVTLTERFTRALELKEKSALFSELNANGFENDGKKKWKFRLVIGEPSIYRNDRKQIFIYVNGRKVQEFSLLQAIEYGCQGFFPNGVHPVAALFVEVDPSMVDFNIHPAKKEVRFKDISCIHHGVSSTVKTFFRSYTLKSTSEQEEIEDSLQNDFFEPKKNNSEYFSDFSQPQIPQIQKTYTKDFNSVFTDRGYKIPTENQINTALHYTEEKITSVAETSDYSNLREKFLGYESEKKFDFNHSSKNLANIALNSAEDEDSAQDNKITEEKNGGFKFFGTTLGTFLLAEKANTLYLIDQHAAHERILFNKIMSEGGSKQNLLVPYTIKTDSNDDDKYLESIKQTLETTGFEYENKGDGQWEFKAVPARWTGTQKDLEEALLGEHFPAEEIMYKIAAMTACKAAVKDGTILDFQTAEKLARDALNLKDPHCPHGRPVWTTLTREQLFSRVRRT